MSRTLFVFLIAGLLLIGGCLNKQTSDNNNKENTDTDNSANQNGTVTPTPTAVCTSTSQAAIEQAINDLPPGNKVKIQYQNNNFTFSYNNYELIIKGFVDGDNTSVYDLIVFFDDFRGKDCARNVLFQGTGGNGDFEWRASNPNPNPPDKCETKVNEIINTSDLGTQPKFKHEYDKDTKILYIYETAGDIPGKKRLNSLFNKLKAQMQTGCIKKVVFGKKPESAVQQLLQLNAGRLVWSVCEPPNSCEENGTCVPC